MSIVAWFDGACWPNPNGPAAAGALVKSNSELIYSTAKYLGEGGTSGNLAEYEGLVLVLQYFLDYGINDALVCGDSQLVIHQISRLWKVKKNRPSLYLPSYYKAVSLADQLPSLEYKWVPRDENKEADLLSTEPLRRMGLRDPYKKCKPIFMTTDLETEPIASASALEALGRGAR
jgi:ribonuclease HI